MKKTFKLVLFLFITGILTAQNIPTDPNVKIGKLENGLTYYIKKNLKPEKKVELRLAINAGSNLEDDDQRGLAHFMEHMNFNGTTNFPKNKLVDYLQSIGVKFGQHLNAYTSFEETVYMLPIPLDKPGNLETGLKVMEDWAFNAQLTTEEINKERGVVLEELRLGLGPDKRMLDKYLPKVLYNSQYAKRLPIGDKTLLETFKPEVVQRYHADWYRPNLMALIVVGDIDINDIEKRIKENFSKYKNPTNSKPRLVFDVPNHKETFVSIESDPDASFSQVQLVYKDLDRAKNSTTIEEYNHDLVENIFTTMLNNRLQELVDSSNPPFTYGYSYHGGTWARTKEGFQSFAMCNEGKQMNALQVLMEETERAKRFGFSQNELDRAKSEFLAEIESSYKEKDKKESKNLVNELVNNFLEQEPIPGIEWEYNQTKTQLPNITLAQVNNIVKDLVREENRVVVITGPNKTTIAQPSEKEVLALFDKVKTEDLKPYEDKATLTNLIKTLPNKGSVTKTEQDTKLGTTTWILSNGAKVTFKKTDFKNDEIKFDATSIGGSSLFNDEEYRKTQWGLQILDEAGINGFSKTDITKFLAGKVVKVTPYIGNISEGLNGSSTPKDLETLFQLAYSYFTGLNYDEAAYKGAIDKQSAIYNNLLSQPNFYFQSEYVKFRQQNNPRFTGIVPFAEDWKKTDLKLAYQKYKERFADAKDFTFYFVGNIDETQLKTYCEKYLATLPSAKAIAEKYKDTGYRNIKGEHKKTYNKGKDPKSMVRINYSGETAYNPKEAIALEALGKVLTIKLVERLRETESGVYGVGANGGMSKTPYESYNFFISFPCGPENTEKLISSTLDEVKKIIEKGPEQKDVDKYKEGDLNDLKEDLKKNETWINALSRFQQEGGNKYAILEEENLIKGITVADIQAVAKKYLTQQKTIGILMPEAGYEKPKTEAPKTAGIPDISIKKVIENYITALGGKQKIEAIKTLKYDVSMDYMGMNLAGVEKKMQPNKNNTILTFNGQEIKTVFDGTKGYIVQAGQKMDLPPAALENAKKDKMFFGIDLDESKILNLEVLTQDAKEIYVMKTQDEKYFFAKSTALLTKMETKEGSISLEDYKEFDGIKIPLTQTSEGQGVKISKKVSNVVFNKDVSETDFN